MGLSRSSDLRDKKQAPDGRLFCFSLISPIAVVMPAMAMVVMPMPRAIAADLARPVMGPDHPAVTVRIGVIARIVIVGRRVEASMEVMMPVGGRNAIAAVTDAAEAMAAAMEDGRGAKTAAMDRATAASESAAMEGRAAATESATAVKAAAVATATMPATTMTAAAPTTTSAANLGRQPVMYGFR